MTKNQLKFLKLLKKHGTLTAPQICKKLKIKKHSIYSTEYSELLQYINYPDNEHNFDSLFNIKHYIGDEETSCKSEFSLTQNGEETLNFRRPNKMNIFIITTTILALIISLISLFHSFFL